MFGVDSTFDAISIEQNNEYKDLLAKKIEGNAVPEDLERFEELTRRLSLLRMDPTLVISQEDPITQLVKERISEEVEKNKALFKAESIDTDDLKNRVNVIIDNLLKS